MGSNETWAGPEAVTLTPGKDWTTLMSHTFTVKLNAGENKIRISTPANFDNNTIGVPNIYALTYTLSAEDAALPIPTAADASVDFPLWGVAALALLLLAGVGIGYVTTKSKR